MNTLLARSAIAKTLVSLFVLIAVAGAQTYSILTSFDGTNGYEPFATPLIDSLGNVFGTTPNGGVRNWGVVYRGSVSGGSNTYETLYSFTCGNDGGSPIGGLVMDSAGNLYGTALGCGENNDGTVYRLKPSSGKYRFKVLLAFNGTNGAAPIDEAGHLALDSAGNIFETAEQGGAHNEGVVFKLAAGSFLYTNLHDFSRGTDGFRPSGGVSLDSLGNLYGTTDDGGINGDNGTVWQIANP